MSKCIIIQGAAGFVGRHLVAALHNRGHKIIGLAHQSCSVPAGVELAVGQFDTPTSFTPFLRQAHTFIHAASGSTPGSTAGQPLAELERNLHPTLALLESLQQQPACRLIYLSSGGALYGDTQDQPATENHPLQPRSYYAAGKAAAEHFIHAASQQYHLSSIALRPSNLYGPGQGLRSGFGIIPTTFAHAQSGEPVTLWGNGHTLRDYLYIDDFIELCVRLTEQPIPEGSRSLNVASGRAVSLLTLMEYIQETTGKAIQIRHDMSRRVDVEKIELSIEQITHFNGWMPKTSLKEGLAQTWKWWLREYPEKDRL